MSLDAQEESGWLSPIQLTYTSQAMSLPIRLGTANSPGEQDLVLYTLTDHQGGMVGISNYPETFLLDNECMFEDAEWDSFGDFYATRLDDAFSQAQEASWITEYSWGAAKCDPCPPGGSIDQQTASELGFQGSVQDSWFTRIRIRYTPEQAHQDLALYETGIAVASQARFIRYNASLEDQFPVCDVGFVEDAGTCDDDADDEVAQSSEGCSIPVRRRSPLALLSLLAGSIVLRRRRRS